MSDLAHIEKLAAQHDKDRQALGAAVSQLQAVIDKETARAMPRIRRLASKCADSKDALIQSVEDNRGLFKRPRTRTIHGIKIGTRKMPGQVIVPNPDHAVLLIEKHYPVEAESAIKTTKRIVKKALENWTTPMLKKCGIEVTADSDAVVVKPMDSEIDSMVGALLANREVDDED